MAVENVHDQISKSLGAKKSTKRKIGKFSFIQPLYLDCQKHHKKFKNNLPIDVSRSLQIIIKLANFTTNFQVKCLKARCLIFLDS